MNPKSTEVVDDLHWQILNIDADSRANLKDQKPICIWLTGLSGSGKSTLGNMLEARLHGMGFHTYMLDGDNLRHGLCKDLGFCDQSRSENIRRAAEVARLMVDAGLIVIVSLISPFRADRAFARSLFPSGAFCEVFVDTPLEECMRRDPKGLYAKAGRGQLTNFTGLDSAYEAPEAPDVHITTASLSAVDGVELVLGKLFTS